MIIDLPQSFSYAEGTRKKAYVESDNLVIIGNVNFESLMYQIAYATKDASKCYYCGETLDEVLKKRSLDHMYPKVWGGISIPCNLVPACKRCNSEKNALTANQYICWRDVRRRKKAALKKAYLLKNKKNSYLGKIMPEDWITYLPTDTVSRGIYVPRVHSTAYTEITNFFEKHHHYIRPVVMSSNGIVLFGKEIIGHAIEHNVRTVPAVVLDNVIVRKDEKEEETP